MERDPETGNLPTSANVDSLQNGGSNDAVMTAASTHHFAVRHRTRWLILCVLVILGVGVSSSFFSLGFAYERDSIEQYYETSTTDIANAIQSTWQEY